MFRIPRSSAVIGVKGWRNLAKLSAAQVLELAVTASGCNGRSCLLGAVVDSDALVGRMWPWSSVTLSQCSLYVVDPPAVPPSRRRAIRFN